MMLKKGCFIAALVFVVLPALAFGLGRDEALEFFGKAGLAYKKGDYREAVSLYERVRREGWESGPLYYNLANSYFKAGDLGRAVLNYERARLLMPRDSDLRANDRYARSLVQATASGGSPTLGNRLIQAYPGLLTSEETVNVLFAVFVLAGLVHLTAMHYPSAQTICRRTGMLLVIIFLVFLGGFVAVTYSQAKAAVILTAVQSRFEPRDQATVHFDLAPGQRVRMISREGGWVKVERPDRKKGWIPAETVAAIRDKP